MAEGKRLTWFVLIRVVVVSLFLLSIIILNIKEPGTLDERSVAHLITLIIATYCFSILSLLFIKLKEGGSRTLTYLQILWDLAFVTFLILITGGINSPYSFLYFLSILNASFLLARREAIYTASLCSILYGAILDLQYYGKLTVFGLGQPSAEQHGASYVFYTIFVNILAYYLTALLSGYLAERAIRSESALQKKVIDYEELEQLNSAIVANLNSGLLTINNAGRIRVFNPYAEGLTGISQEEAYDRPLAEVIPGFKQGISAHHGGETGYESASGEKITLGFKSVPFTDREGNTIGEIIDFQDLTQFKQLQVELKKADRLAAIGELSAKIAHEIRNPLAAISGSVQLMAQRDGIDAKDRQLLDIVLRESNRLNELIGGFLLYARPATPVRFPLCLKRFIDDLASLFKMDPRFEQVQIVNDCPDNLSIAVDRDQFQQVFWNLLVNAVEAMTGGGIVTIDAEYQGVNAQAPRDGEVVRITVRDNGKGMHEDDMRRVFEPFFTTKAGGTGLGLATVYRIIESHGGAIRVNSVLGKGTCFTISVPAGEVSGL
jgi:two-component system sensor histidine kinase PilS (NtrC family)